MHKFNVGDRVRVVKCEHGHGHEINEVVTIDTIDYEQKEIYTGYWYLQFDEIEPVEVGPIRTVTRKEIVPGVYGRLHILKVTDENKVYVNLNEDGEAYTRCRNTTSMSATELREAAHILVQLAEVLEDE